MGAGKTSVGRALAERLGYTFVDIDQQVEASAGATVREIFERDGEAYFRALELEQIAASRVLADAVIATGGGTIAQPGMREQLADGFVVWISPPFGTIASRIGARGKAERPLFRDEGQALELYRSRLDAYRSADLRVDVRPDESVEETVARLELVVRQMR